MTTRYVDDVRYTLYGSAAFHRRTITINPRQGNHKTPTEYSRTENTQPFNIWFENPNAKPGSWRLGGTPALGQGTFNQSAVTKAAQLKLVDIPNFYMGCADIIMGCTSMAKYLKGASRILTDMKRSGVDPRLPISANKVQNLKRWVSNHFNYHDYVSNKTVGYNPILDAPQKGGNIMALAANVWLEYQYSILPSMRATAELFDRISGKPDTVLCRITSSYKLERAEHVDKLNSPNSGITTHIDYKYRESCRCFRYMRLSDKLPEFDTSGRAAATAAWDLVPFSFLVDWCIPIGDMLTSWIPSGRKSYTGCDSYKGVCDVKYKVDKPAYGGWDKYSIPVGELSDSYQLSFRFSRKNNTSLSADQITAAEAYALSGFKATSTKVANAISLLTQRFGRR